MKTLLLKLLAIAMTVQVCVADEGLFLCNVDGSLKITGIKVTSFVPNRAFAPTKSASCSSWLNTTAGIIGISGSGTNASPYTVASIPANSVECGATSAGTVHTYKIIVASTANIIKASDLMFTFNCDTTSLNEVVRSAVITSVSGDPTTGNVTVDVPVTMSIVTSASVGSDITSTTLGSSCKLKMKLDISTAVKKCKITTCEAASDSAFTNPLSLYDTNGCSVSSSGVYTNTNGSFSETRSTFATYLSDSFDMFRFPDVSAVYFRCTCRGCLTTGDVACTTTCSGVGRKRRDVSEVMNRTLSSTVMVLVFDKTKKVMLPGQTLQQETNIAKCLNHVSFISVVAILALLLMISLAVSVFFCSKLIRQRHQPKEFYPIPAYKD